MVWRRQELSEIGFTTGPDLSFLHEDLDALEGEWDIPDMHTDTMRKARSKNNTMIMPPLQYGPKDEENMKALGDVVSRFSSLQVKLRYVRKVLRPGVAPVWSIRAADDGQIYWPVEETVSLHQVAAKMFMDAFKVPDVKFMLASSSFALKAIHTVAIAVRGLLRRAVGDGDISDVERTAVGNVSHLTETSKDEVTVMLEKKVAEAGKEKGRRERIWISKLFMDWDAYEKCRSNVESERPSAAGTLSEVDIWTRESNEPMPWDPTSA